MSYNEPAVSNSQYLLYQPDPRQGYQPSDYPPSAPPPQPDSSAAAASKFTVQSWRDVAWAVLFVIHLVAYIGVGSFLVFRYRSELTVATATNTTSASHVTQPGVYGGYMLQPRLYERFYKYESVDTMYEVDYTSTPNISSSIPYTTIAAATDSSNATATTDSHIRLQRNVLYLGGLTIVSSALVALLWLALVKTYAHTMIYVALTADIVVSVLVALVALLNGSVVGAVILFVFAGLKALWVYWVRSRIAFAAVILTHAVQCIHQWPATIAAAFLSIAVQVAWAVGWAFCTVGFYYAATRVTDADQCASNTTPTNGQEQQCDMQRDNTVSYVVLFLTLVSFYWTSQVVKNVLHVTVAGVAATYYFLVSPSNPNPPNPTAGSLKRATTTSFGSICLGSLILSLVRALRAVVILASQQPNGNARGGAAVARACAYCVARCLLGILDRVVEYVNQYAFAQVAIYGKSYCEAAHATWELFKVRGFEALINDSLVGVALGFASLMGGLTGAAVSAALSSFVFEEAAGSWVVWAVIGFLFGFGLTMLAVEVVESAVTTLFVCLAEDPASLQRSKPAMYAQLVPPIHERYPQVHFGAY